MYTIKEASARSGVGAPLIRAWERRYGVVRPARTTAGYRLYDDATINVLATMRALIEAGWTASQAARAISAGEVPVEAVPVEDRSMAAASEREAAPSAAAEHRARTIARFVAAAQSTSPADTEAALDAIFAAGSFEAIVDDLLMPATAALGEAWTAGTLSVAAEHAASAAVGRRLAAVYQAAGVPARPSALVGLPPGGRHELGTLAFAAALRRRGVGVLYLGPDVTVEGWIDVAARTRARVAVIGVVVPADREGAAAVIAALQAQAVPIVAVGGAAAGQGLAPTDGLLVLPQNVVEAAAIIARAVGRRD
jgi:DNA-binding transcriptional MerR regulator/methylmalonyl-CoA mutase cobalamin-binding subunit